VSSDTPDAYFAERGFELVVVERDLDSELPPDASTRGSTHWADLVRIATGKVVPAYGAGHDVDSAKISAMKRWVVEQERPKPLPHHLP
jgi:hypothetical protein